MNSETMRQVYLDAQKACGLRKGDWVKVLAKSETEECGCLDNGIVVLVHKKTVEEKLAR